MPIERIPMTPEGKRQLEERLKYLKSVERPNVIKAITTAREHGDLSENAEYDAAKEKQLHVSKEMEHIEHKLSLCQLIDPAKLNSKKVLFGATVTLSKIETDEEVTYKIVGVDEANVRDGKISIESPIARAIIGKEVGDEVTVKTPNKPVTYEIVDIEYM